MKTLLNKLIKEFLSLPNFRQAWYKVADNRGGAGIDGETIEKFAANEENNLIQLLDAVANNYYTPQPLRQVIIPKKDNKQRELRIPTIRDRIVQMALLNVLYPITEEIFSDSSYAYRPNRHYTDAVKRVAYWRDRGYQWVLDGDIVEFFAQLDHERLLREVRKVIDNSGILCLIKAWISVGIETENGMIYPERGVPQGAVISPILANLYLNEFDHYFQQSEIQLVRYADDFLLLSQSQDGIMSAYAQVVQLLHYLKLELHQQKSQITHFDNGFQFLGHGFLRKNIFPMDDETKTGKDSRKKKSLRRDYHPRRQFLRKKSRYR